MNPEPPSPPAADRPLTPVWLFIVAVLVIESLLRLLPENTMTRTLRHRSEEILHLPATNIQFMGDSATNAVRVSLIDQHLGHTRELSNYALPGTTPLFCYFVLKRQIEAGKIPKLIVFAPHPFTWGDSFMDRFVGRFAQAGESVSLLHDGVHLDDWLYGTLCRMSYTLRYREELYKVVTQGDLSFFESWSQAISPVQNTQGKIAPEEPRPPEPAASALDPNNLPPILQRPISIHPYNELYLDKFCELAAQHQIRVVWLTLPIPQLIADRLPPDERGAAYRAFVERMCARHPNLVSLSSELPVQPNHHYRDPWHLNAYGAFLFSQRTGSQLAEYLRTHPLP